VYKVRHVPERLDLNPLVNIDAMLACWARDEALFRRVAQRIDTYLGPILTLAPPSSNKELERLKTFQSVWATVSQELLKDR
jgi:hypothetical protein